jgi:hypothetical protein
MEPGKTVFDVRRGDEWIRVSIEGETAELVVVGIDDVSIVIEALNRAVAAGAIRGTMLTGEIVDEQMAAMHRMRAEVGMTWLGGRVTLLAERANGPVFRIDWDTLPSITE